MKLFKEIRDGVVDHNTSISSVLRKAKILGASLKNDAFKEWVSRELDGYPNNGTVPPYRRWTAPVLGTFSGPFGRRIENYPLPVHLMPDFLQAKARELIFTHPIREIETLASTEQSSLLYQWEAEAVLILREQISLSGEFVLIGVHQPITKANLEGMVDAVRNRLLDFLLGLQEANESILESDDAFNQIPRDVVSQMFNLTIYGDHNILATGAGITQSVGQNVAAGDVEVLLQSLKTHGVSNPDLVELRQALEKDGSRPKGKFGERVKQWLGKMVTKAADGSWQVTLGTSSSILAEALSRYYGWK